MSVEDDNLEFHFKFCILTIEVSDFFNLQFYVPT